MQVAHEIDRLAVGGRNRSLKPNELSGSTFTISNYGSYGGGMGTPIINPPEVAILGVGRMKDEVVAQDGQPVVRPILPLALSFDHRLIDGAASGRFMRTLIDLLENPAQLMLDMV
jgi:pyruvate dehydrogenase E2 component (dihydrolipoamide acetyltransferase)